MPYSTPKGRGGGGVLVLIFAGNVPLASQSPYPIIVYSMANNIIDPLLAPFGHLFNFRNPSLVSVYCKYIPYKSFK